MGEQVIVVQKGCGSGCSSGCLWLIILFVVLTILGSMGFLHRNDIKPSATPTPVPASKASQ